MAKFSTYLAIFKAPGQILFVLGGQMLKNNLSTWSHNSLHIKWYIFLKIQWSLFFLLDAYLLQKLNYNQDSLSAIILKVIGYKSYHNLVAQILRNLLGNRFAKNVNFK